MYDHSYRFLCDDALPIQADSELWIIPDLMWRGSALVAPTAPVPFEEFTAYHVTKKVKAPGSEDSRPARQKNDDYVMAKILEEFPWLSAKTIQEVFDDTGEMAPLHPPPPAAAVDSVDDEALEERLLTAFDRLRDLRAEHAAEDDDEETMDHFYYRIMGGKWTEKHKSKVADACGTFARSHAQVWSRLFKWPTQKSFAFSKYGERDSINLAKEWSRRGNFFCQLWYDEDAPADFAYTDEQLQTYQESEGFLDWATSIDVNSDTMDAIIEMRKCLPCCDHGKAK